MQQRQEPRRADKPAPAGSAGRRGRNHLLAAIPEAEYRLWEPHLELVDLRLGQVLCEPGSELEYAYFPATAIVSLL